jgi:hypothetical protein
VEIRGPGNLAVADRDAIIVVANLVAGEPLGLGELLGVFQGQSLDFVERLGDCGLCL